MRTERGFWAVINTKTEALMETQKGVPIQFGTQRLARIAAKAANERRDWPGLYMVKKLILVEESYTVHKAVRDMKRWHRVYQIKQNERRRAERKAMRDSSYAYPRI